jgi:hypothetical protein
MPRIDEFAGVDRRQVETDREQTALDARWTELSVVEHCAAGDELLDDQIELEWLPR